jgi:hypothetical protein
MFILSLSRLAHESVSHFLFRIFQVVAVPKAAARAAARVVQRARAANPSHVTSGSHDNSSGRNSGDPPRYVLSALAHIVHMVALQMLCVMLRCFIVDVRNGGKL